MWNWNKNMKWKNIWILLSLLFVAIVYKILLVLIAHNSVLLCAIKTNNMYEYELALGSGGSIVFIAQCSCRTSGFLELAVSLS